LPWDPTTLNCSLVAPSLGTSVPTNQLGFVLGSSQPGCQPFWAEQMCCVACRHWSPPQCTIVEPHSCWCFMHRMSCCDGVREGFCFAVLNCCPACNLDQLDHQPYLTQIIPAKVDACTICLSLVFLHVCLFGPGQHHPHRRVLCCSPEGSTHNASCRGGRNVCKSCLCSRPVLRREGGCQ
jgi:hypothetical protein